MGTRGPQARETVKTSVRLSAGLRTKLDAAAKKHGKKVSSEIENRLNKSFADEFSIVDEFGDRQILAVARIAFAAARSTVSRGIDNNEPKMKAPPPRPAVNWLADPAAFDAAVTAINRVLELIRPDGVASSDPDGVTYKPAFNAEELVREIATAPLAAPAKASRHVMATIARRNDVGDDVLDRAGGVQARSRSAWAQEYGALRRKQAKAPATMTNEELARMRALKAERERLLTDSTAISKDPKP